MKLVSLKDDVISFAKQAVLSRQQMRYDYTELLELTALFLGDTPPRGVQIMARSDAQSPVEGQVVVLCENLDA